MTFLIVVLRVGLVPIVALTSMNVQNIVIYVKTRDVVPTLLAPMNVLAMVHTKEKIAQ